MQENVLAATGWQDICLKFHRKHPATCRKCNESAARLTLGVEPGAIRCYRCLNGLWDIMTPIAVDGTQIAKLYAGQFLYDDETVDYDSFREAARSCGFDEAEYIAALDRVPRLSQATVKLVMGVLRAVCQPDLGDGAKRVEVGTESGAANEGVDGAKRRNDRAAGGNQLTQHDAGKTQ